ncbi:MAG: DUF2442 domain-containing protein [Prevotellaceae bacterium]|jgi:hypothetical protein|nr:DUF2442 domain-containing protein [Prevotellaceae bacterium]
MNETKYINIVNADYLGDYKIKLQFNDDVVRQIDFGYFLQNHPHPQHNKYRDLRNFRKFKIDGGNIVWGKNWDLIFNPRKLYEGINPQ